MSELRPSGRCRMVFEDCEVQYHKELSYPLSPVMHYKVQVENAHGVTHTYCALFSEIHQAIDVCLSQLQEVKP